jgi:hypothetical protein
VIRPFSDRIQLLFRSSSLTDLFFLLTSSNKWGARCLWASPSNQLLCQKRAFSPSPTVTFVEALKSSHHQLLTCSFDILQIHWTILFLMNQTFCHGITIFVSSRNSEFFFTKSFACYCHISNFNLCIAFLIFFAMYIVNCLCFIGIQRNNLTLSISIKSYSSPKIFFHDWGRQIEFTQGKSDRLFPTWSSLGLGPAQVRLKKR